MESRFPKSDLQKVMLITRLSPYRPNNGTVTLLHRIAGLFQEPWLTWVSLDNEKTGCTLSQIEILSCPPPGKPYRLVAGRWGSFWCERFWGELTARKLAYYCRLFSIDRIWTLAEERAGFVGRRLAQITGLPLHVTIHDHPMRSCQLNPDVPLWHVIRTKRHCRALLRAANSVDTVSFSLADYVRQKTLAQVRIYPPQVYRAKSPPLQRKSDGVFRIGFCGECHTGSNEIKVFLSWLKKIGGKFEFHAFGSRSLPAGVESEMKQFGNTVYHAFEPDWDRYISALGTVDCFYIGAWFSPNMDLTVRYSFPSKTGPVLAAGIPIIAHGPGTWELHKWLNLIPFGFAIESIDENRPPKSLYDFIRFPDNRQYFARAAAIAFQRWFQLPDDRDNRIGILPWQPKAGIL
ncbi:MAG: hypothetical protein AB1847_04125 [bacterium]